MIELDRSLPCSLDAERAILGAILLDNSCWPQTERITAEDFFLDSHKRIYRRMAELASEERPIDFVTLTECLGQHKEIEAANGVAYVTSLTDGLPRVKNIEQYVRIVLEKSRRRKFILLTSQALEEAYDDCGPIEDLIARTEHSLIEVETRKKSEPKKLCEILPESDLQIRREQAVSIERESVGCRTGLKNLDSFTTGYRPKEVTVISGWTSDGKTSLLRQGVIANVIEGVKTFVVSREVSRQRLTLDLKGVMSGVSASHVRDPRKMDIFEREKFQKINDLLKNWPLWIDDTRGIHIDEVHHRARKLVRQEGIQLMFIDYIQLIRGSGNNETAQVEDVCQGIWDIADGEEIAVVALSQMSRDEKRQKRRPRLQDLKQSSMIEQCGHCVTFVYQPEDEQGVRQPEKSEIIVAKQRHGPTGPLYVAFDTDTLMFTERY